MPPARPFTVCPPLRCDWKARPGDVLTCGAPAVGIQFAHGELPTRFRCGQHLELGDEAIPDSYCVQRVTLRCDVLFAGVALGPTLAKAEALARLETAVAAAGGLLNLHDVIAEMGRYTVPTPPSSWPAAGRRVGR